MTNFILSACSTVDLPRELTNQYGISILNFNYYVDGQELIDDYGECLSFSKFYSDIEKGADTKTSMLSSAVYEEYFRKFLENGKDVLHITLSSGLSGTYQSALVAKENLKKEFPDGKIFIIDSLGASSGSGLLLLETAKYAKLGKTIEETANFAETLSTRIHYIFCSTTLKTYIKGGRISKTAGAFGTALKICPVMNVSPDGKLQVVEKIRTSKNAINRVSEMAQEVAEFGKDYDGPIFISHSDCLDLAKMLESELKKRFSNIKGEVPKFFIGPTIGSHSGKGTVAVYLIGDKRK